MGLDFFFFVALEDVGRTSDAGAESLDDAGDPGAGAFAGDAFAGSTGVGDFGILEQVLGWVLVDLW